MGWFEFWFELDLIRWAMNKIHILGLLSSIFRSNFQVVFDWKAKCQRLPASCLPPSYPLTNRTVAVVSQWTGCFFQQIIMWQPSPQSVSITVAVTMMIIAFYSTILGDNWSFPENSP